MSPLIVDLETTTPGPKPPWDFRQLCAWSAGFIMGDGTLGIYRMGDPAKKGSGWSPRLRASNADLVPLRRLQSIFGGAIWPLSIRPRQTTQHYEWCVQGYASRVVVRKIYHYLGGRHRWLAALFLLFPYYARGTKGVAGYTDDEHELRREVIVWMRQAIKVHL